MVRVYYFDIRRFPVDDLMEGSSSLLNRSENAKRIMHYLTRADRSRTLAGELILRGLTVSSVIRCDANRRAIKPCVGSDIMFNVSHDEDFVIVGTSTSLSVGIDIMKVQLSAGNSSVDTMFHTLRNIFTEKEWNYVRGVGLDDNTQLARFFHIWTAKEAYVKCIGTGLYTEPQEVEIFVESSNSEEIRMTICQVGFEAACKFRLSVLPALIPGYVVAVCVGAVDLCDASWTQFCARFPTTAIGRMDISEATELTLEDLVGELRVS